MEPIYVNYSYEASIERGGPEGNENGKSKKQSPSIDYNFKLTLGVQGGGSFGLGGKYGLFANLFSVTLFGYDSKTKKILYPSSQAYGFSQINQSLSGGFWVGGELSHTFDGSFSGYGYENSQKEFTGSALYGKGGNVATSLTYNFKSKKTTRKLFTIPIRVGLIIGVEINISLPNMKLE